MRALAHTPIHTNTHIKSAYPPSTSLNTTEIHKYVQACFHYSALSISTGFK
jgi:hypothetical protein